jgi:hypothetical protein
VAALFGLAAAALLGADWAAIGSSGASSALGFAAFLVGDDQHGPAILEFLQSPSTPRLTVRNQHLIARASWEGAEACAIITLGKRFRLRVTHKQSTITVPRHSSDSLRIRIGEG